MLTGARSAWLILIALSLVLLAEIGFEQRIGDSVESGIPSLVGVAASDDDLPAFVLPEPKAFAEIAERPLFVAGRRPPDPAAAAPRPPQQTSLKPEPVPEFVISAIVRERNRWIALLETRRNPSPLQVEVGSTVAGWKVERIEIDGILLRQGERTTQLSLRSY